MTTLIFNSKQHGNIGIIQKVDILPYKNAPKKVKSYRVIAIAQYNKFIYHISIFETLEEAKNDLRTLCFNIK